MAIFGECQLCGKRLPPFSRRAFCGPAHQQAHDDHQRALYLARLAENIVEVNRLNADFEGRLWVETASVKE